MVRGLPPKGKGILAAGVGPFNIQCDCFVTKRHTLVDCELKGFTKSCRIVAKPPTQSSPVCDQETGSSQYEGIDVPELLEVTRSLQLLGRHSFQIFLST